MYCRKCGAENKDDAVFCSTCGVPFGDDVAVDAEPVATAEVSEEVPAEDKAAVPAEEAVEATQDEATAQSDQAAPAEPVQATAPAATAPKKKTPLIIGIVAVVAVVAIVAGVLLARGGSPKQDPIVGTWNAVQGVQDGKTTNLAGSGVTFEVNANGTFVYTLDSDFVLDGTWQTHEGDEDSNILGYYEGTFSELGVGLAMVLYDYDGNNILGIGFTLGGSDWVLLFERA